MQPTGLTHLFLSHPRTVGETYLQHMRVAFGMCRAMLKLAVAAALHGIVPALHQSTVSDQIIAMAEDMKARKARQSI